jgi:diaminobutyrate-2-oxoglutarate transaminase
VASTELFSYWENDNLSEAVKYKENILKEGLEKITQKYPSTEAKIRGRGLIYGLNIPFQGFCHEVSAEAFERGLIIELAGAKDDVLKFLPPLVIEEELLKQGLEIIDDSIGAVLDQRNAVIRGETEC